MKSHLVLLHKNSCHFSILAPSWTELLNVNIPNDCGGEGGGLVPHQSAIYKALFGIWGFFFLSFFYTCAVKTTHATKWFCFGFFVPVNVTAVNCIGFFFFSDRLECSKENVWSLRLSSWAEAATLVCLSQQQSGPLHAIKNVITNHIRRVFDFLFAVFFFFLFPCLHVDSPTTFFPLTSSSSSSPSSSSSSLPELPLCWWEKLEGLWLWKLLSVIPGWFCLPCCMQ